MPFAELNGQRIHYRDEGPQDTVPLLLAHGFLMDLEMFDAQAQAFAGARRVIRWDARGHGLTESDGEPFTYWDSAEDGRALLDHLGVERAVAGGMSQGGFVGLRFALSHPNRAAGLVLIDTQAGLEVPDKVADYDLMVDVWTADGATEPLAEAVAAIIIGPDAPQSAAYREKWRSLGPDRLRNIYRTLMDRDDVSDRLGEIDAPAVVIHGSEDMAIDIERAQALCRGLRGCSGVVEVPGAGHASNLTHPDPVNRAISEFLDRLEPAGRPRG